MSTFSQDCVQPVIIKEEGVEAFVDQAFADQAFADQASSDSGQYREDPGQEDDDDPDYQVDFAWSQFILCFLKKARQVMRT